jgi:hypothetical protein
MTADTRPYINYADAETRYKRWAEAQGYRPSEARPCPMKVAGKSCQAYRAYADQPACICERHQHLLDHGRIWLDQAGGYILTSEPYDAPGDELAGFIADLEALGLRLSLSGVSPWYPGYTFKLTIARGEVPLDAP